MLVRHQVKYLGLMEHLRVRRAGFAYRRKYEIFLQRYLPAHSLRCCCWARWQQWCATLCSLRRRYKPLCPDTWPNWKGTAAEGVRRLISHLGYKRDEYKMGRYEQNMTLNGRRKAHRIQKNHPATPPPMAAQMLEGQ